MSGFFIDKAERLLPIMPSNMNLFLHEFKMKTWSCALLKHVRSSFHCTKNEDFHYGFLQKMWKLKIWSLLLEKSMMENFIFYAVKRKRFMDFDHMCDRVDGVVHIFMQM